MHGTSTLAWSPRDTTLLAWCVAGSIAAHGLLLTALPGMHKEKEPPMPLTVELRKPPEIEPPKPLPVEKKPPPPEPDKTKPAPREERPVETPRQILTTPPDAAPVPAAPPVPVAPEQKPAPSPEAPRVPQAPPVPVTQPVFNAAYLNNPKPDYPQMAFRRGETGTVYVLVLVTKEGRAGRVSVHKSSGSSALDTAATRAISGWRFEPGRKGMEAVESEVIVPMPFTLKDAP